MFLVFAIKKQLMPVTKVIENNNKSQVGVHCVYIYVIEKCLHTFTRNKNVNEQFNLYKTHKAEQNNLLFNDKVYFQSNIIFDNLTTLYKQ